MLRRDKYDNPREQKTLRTTPTSNLFNRFGEVATHSVHGLLSVLRLFVADL